MAGIFDKIRSAFLGQQQFVSPAPSTVTAQPGSQEFFQAQQRSFVDPGQVKRDKTTAVTGSGGVPSLPTQQVGEAPFEQAPSQPSIDYNSIFAPAFEALSKQEGALQSGYQADLVGAETGATSRKAELAGEQERRLGEYGQQRTTETGRTEGVINEAKRMAAELLQGNQARFGGSTGTGRFASEILGSQATRNISQNRAALQETLGQIGQAETNLKDEVLRINTEIDQNLQAEKAQLKAQLDQNLASIAGEKGRLESEKGKMRVDTINQYQQTLAGIDARNTQFRQTLYQQAQAAQTEIEKLKSRATQGISPAELQNFEAISVPLGDTGESVYYTPDAPRGYSSRVAGEKDEDGLEGLL